METGSVEIVLIDDSPDDAFFAKRLIRQAREGVSARAFDSSVNAVKYLSDPGTSPIKPGGFFVDIRMPQMDGFEVLAWIRRNANYDATPVVMLSGSDEPRDLERAKALRADCYLKKFPSVPEMQSVLECVRLYKKLADSRCADFSIPVNLLSTL